MLEAALARLALATFVIGAAASCGPPPRSTAARPPEVKTNAPATTKVIAFGVAQDSLSVDAIGMRDGLVRPDGNRDLAFTATVEGPIDALFMVNCDEKGNPLQGFRADTIIGHEELPAELGNVIDVGRLTTWIAAVEDGKFINNDSGTLRIPVGQHTLKLYVPNTGTLRAGTHLRLYARGPSSGLVGGPVVPY